MIFVGFYTPFLLYYSHLEVHFVKNLNFIEVFNIIFLIAIVISDICYLFINTSEYITKTIASSIFVLGGLINLIYVLKNKKSYSSSPNFKWWMMLGLVSACLGDILLIDYFILGVIFFALGHVLFFISFCMIEKFKLKDIFYGGSLFIVCALIILLYKGFDFEGMKFLILIYALIISLMVGKSVSNFTSLKSTKNLIVAIGTILFFLSDFFLLFRLFAGMGRIGSILCLIFYYPAEFVLAYSIYVVSKEKNHECI